MSRGFAGLVLICSFVGACTDDGLSRGQTAAGGPDGGSHRRSDAGDAALEAAVDGAREAAAETGVVTGPIEGGLCDQHAAAACAVPPTPVLLEVQTPAGTLTLRSARFRYLIGFDDATVIELFPDAAGNEGPSLTVYMTGNPVTSQAGPGDHHALVSLLPCAGVWPPDGEGIVHVYSHDFRTTSDGGYTAALDAALIVNDKGFRMDVRFQVSAFCGVRNTI